MLFGVMPWMISVENALLHVGRHDKTVAGLRGYEVTLNWKKWQITISQTTENFNKCRQYIKFLLAS